MVEVVVVEITPCPFIHQGLVVVAARIGVEEAAALEVGGEEVLEAGGVVAQLAWKSSGKTPSVTVVKSFRELKHRESIAKRMRPLLDQICK